MKEEYTYNTDGKLIGVKIMGDKKYMKQKLLSTLEKLKNG